MGAASSRSAEQKLVVNTTTYASFTDLTNDLRRKGMDSSQIIVAFDFSKSNEWADRAGAAARGLEASDAVTGTLGSASSPGTDAFNLHASSPGRESLYERICRLLAPVMDVFDSDGVIPALRFGDTLSKDRVWLPLDPTTANENCQGFDEVLDAYRRAVRSVRLGGPTSFVPVINYAVEKARQTGEFYILVILTDGAISSFSANARAVIEASNWPVSIVVVGLGDGPFSDLVEFDARLPERKFDNFHFLEFRKYEAAAREAARPDLVLAKHLFEEVPSQYKRCRELGYLRK